MQPTQAPGVHRMVLIERPGAGAIFGFLLLMTEKWQVFQVRSLASKVFKRVDQKYSNRIWRSLGEIFFAQMRKSQSRIGPKKTPGNAVALCAFAPLRLCARVLLLK